MSCDFCLVMIGNKIRTDGISGKMNGGTADKSGILRCSTADISGKTGGRTADKSAVWENALPMEGEKRGGNAGG